MLARDTGDLGDGLDGPDLVVGVHDADEGGVGGDGPPDVVGVDEAVAVHRHDGDPGTEGLDEAAGLEDGGMLDRGGDDVRGGRVGADHALDDLVVRLAAAARQHDLVRVAPEQRRDAAAGRVDRVARGAARPVPARGVAEARVEQGPHGRRHRRRDRRAGVVVEIDARRFFRHRELCFREPRDGAGRHDGRSPGDARASQPDGAGAIVSGGPATPVREGPDGPTPEEAFSRRCRRRGDRALDRTACHPAVTPGWGQDRSVP